jgi:hypothetical protein
MQQASQRNSLDVLGLQDVLSVLACEQQLQDKQGSPVLEPFRPHDGYVKGPPKPHCHEGRVAAADGIQALRRTRDGELGECMVVCEKYTSTFIGFGGGGCWRWPCSSAWHSCAGSRMVQDKHWMVQLQQLCGGRWHFLSVPGHFMGIS